MQEETEDVFVPEETLLGGRYSVKGTLESTSVDAQPHLCSWRGQIYVAKVFYEKSRLDKKIANQLALVDSPYVATTLKTGSYDGHPYMVYPYFKAGSVQGQRFSYEDLLEKIIPQLNRGLRSLHTRGIVDTDLKPSNIMLTAPGGKDIVITDYGRTAVRSLDFADNPNQQVSTEFFAPEVLEGKPVPASDYYSLGVTLRHLFEGERQPGDEDTTPEGEQMPARLANLIAGLTYPDLTFQDDPRNPNKRWTYQEVYNWCEGIDPPVPIGLAQRASTIPAYMFESKQYDSVDELVVALATFWDEGKRHLFDSTLADFFEVVDPEAARICLQAEVDALNSPAREDAIYLETLCLLSPGLTDLYWMGEDLGAPDYVNELILLGNPPSQLRDMAKQGALSSYMYARHPGHKRSVQTMEQAEKAYLSAGDEAARKVAALTIGRLLTGDYTYEINDTEFKSLDEFVRWCLNLRRSDPYAWEHVASQLVPIPGRLTDDFNAWLLALGNADAVQSWMGGRGTDTTTFVPPAPEDAHAATRAREDDMVRRAREALGIDEEAALLADRTGLTARTSGETPPDMRSEEARFASSGRPGAPKAATPQTEEEYFRQVRAYVKMRQQELKAESESHNAQQP